MSRRKLPFPAPAPVPSTPSAKIASTWPPVERILIGALTALIVARPWVAGDDPGRLRLTSGGGTLTLNVLTFGLLLVWIGWRASTRCRLSFGGPILFGLLGIGLATWISASGSDRYRHPGWYLGWEWFTVATLFFLARQLAATPAAARGLTAVLLASALSLSAMTGYRELALLLGLPTMEPAPLPIIVAPLVGDDEFKTRLDRPAPTEGTASRRHSETSAGLLLLMLPAGILAAAASRRAGIIGKSAILIPLLLSIALLLSLPSISQVPWDSRLHGWQTAWSLVQESPWNGVGPGNFSRRAGAEPGSPDNAWLGLSATTGIIATALAIGCLLYFVVVMVRSWNTAPNLSSEETPKRPGPRWEFYYGAIAGSLLGLILGTGDLAAEASASEILRLGIVAAIRALIWFAAFALLETIAFTPQALMRCLMIGVIFTALFGIFSDRLFAAPLNQPFWLAVALAMNLRQPAIGSPAVSQRIGWAVAVIPLLAALALSFFNVNRAALPGWRTAKAVREARRMSREFELLQRNIEGKSSAERFLAVRRADDYLDRHILGPLRRALVLDPDNAALLVQMSQWSRQHWRYLWAMRDLRGANQEAKKIMNDCERAAQLDPYNPAGKLAEFEAILTVMNDAVARKERILGLEKVLAEVTARDPKREVPMRLRMTSVFLDQPVAELIEPHAVELLKLDRLLGSPHGKMTEEQRSRLIERLWQAPIEPSPEMIELMVAEEGAAAR